MVDDFYAAMIFLAGGVVGAVIVAVVAYSLWIRARVPDHGGARVPRVISDLFAAMAGDDTFVLLDRGGMVHVASAAAEKFGIEIHRLLPNDSLRALVDDISDRGSLRSENVVLEARGKRENDSRQTVVSAGIVSEQWILMTIRDVTAHERVEQMRRDFIVNTSHELKTPLGAISLLSEAIESSIDDPAQVREFAGRLSAEVERLSSTISRVMSLSRLQAADELSEVRPVSIDLLITSVIDAHTTQANSAGITLVRGGVDGLFVRGDQQVLTEALANLVANAIAYSHQDSHVGISVRNAGDQVEIVVTDHGIGITLEEQKRIFERFYRADYARSRRTGGNGLGLSIVKHAVQRHGGEVRVWSLPGKGSSFTIVLPATSDPSREVAQPRKGVLRSPRRVKKRVASVTESEGPYDSPASG